MQASNDGFYPSLKNYNAFGNHTVVLKIITTLFQRERNVRAGERIFDTERKKLYKD
jgi:hypothetical protein